MLDRVTSGTRISRRLTRVLSLLVLCLTISLWPRLWGYLLPALSPHVAICSAVASRTISVLPLLPVPMLVVMSLRNRFWCRHLCPVGLTADTCGRLSRKPRSLSLPRSMGRYLALASLGGALVGYPLFLWMDPLALFSGFFRVSKAFGSGHHLISMLGLAIVMLISAVAPGTWCSRICPLGGTQDLLTQVRRWVIKPRRARQLACKSEEHSQRRTVLAAGAGVICAAIIPRKLLARGSSLRPPGSVDEALLKGVCVRCGNCVRVCPTGIIVPSVDSGDLAGFLVPELRFSGSDYCRQDCNKCGLVCPTGAIRSLALEEKNRHVIGIARIDLSDCLLTMEEECGVCIPRCPRGAIVEQFSRETYTVTVNVVRDKCNGCGACVGICPAKVVRIDMFLGHQVI